MDKKKAAVLLAIIPFVLLAMQPAFAEIEQMDKFSDRELIGYNFETGQKTYRFTSYPERILDNSNHYQSFILTNNSNFIQVETAHGSVRLDKSSCAFSYYPKGQIVNGTPLFTDSIIARNAVNGTDNWQAVTQINNATCMTSWDGESLQAKKTKSGLGTLFYRYVDTGVSWKTELEVINLSALTNRKFAFTQTMDINKDTIKFGDTIRNIDNYHNQTFDRNWIESHEAKLLDLMNGFKFDFDLAFDNLWAIQVYDTGISKSKISFDFARNATILLPNESRLYDPTFTSLTSNQGRIYSSGSGSNCAALTGTNADSTLQISKNTGATGCQMVWQEWDITSVPSTSTVSSGYFEWDQTSTSGWPDNCSLYAYATQPSTLSTADKWSQGWAGQGAGTTSLCTTDGTDKQLTLNSTGIANLQSNISGSEGWWGAMFQGVSGAALAGTHEFTLTSSQTRLVFIYTTEPKPDAVTDLTAVATSKTEIFLDWSEPDLNTGTLTGYQTNKTTPTGNPLTIVTNNTGSGTSEATITGLTTCTAYSFRVSAWTEYGNNATGNIANATTSCYTTPSAPTLSATAESDTSIRFTSVNGTTGDFNIAWYGLRCELNNAGGWLTTVSNSTVPSPRTYIYTGLTPADTVTCQWRDGSAAGWGPYSNNATSSPELTQTQEQRPANYDRLTKLAAWFDSMGGVYMGMSLFPFLVMMIGLLARPRTTHIFAIITLCFMGIIHASGYYVYPDWYWTLSLLFGLVIVLAKKYT